MCMCECLHVCYITTHMPCSSLRGQNETLDPLELEIQVLGNGFVDPGNHTQVLSKNKNVLNLGYLSNPYVSMVIKMVYSLNILNIK